MNASAITAGTLAVARGGTGAATLAAAGLVNTPCVKAYGSANYTVATATLTDVPLNTVVFQTGSTFNTGTYKWTPAEAGKYFIYGTTRSNDSSWASFEFNIRTTASSEVARAQGTVITTDTMSCSVVETLSDSDEVWLTMYQDSGGTRTFTGGDSITFMCAYKLIGA
jgi:hypothetical protein